MCVFMYNTRYSGQSLASMNFLHSFWKSSEISNVLKFYQWEPSCSMQTDSHDEPNSRFSELCKAPDIVQFVTRLKHSQGTNLPFSESKGQTLRMT